MTGFAVPIPGFLTINVDPDINGGATKKASGAQMESGLSLFHSLARGYTQAGLFKVTEEIILLTNGGTNHDTVGNLLPANSLILAVSAYLLTAITGTSYNLGDVTSANRFSATSAVLTAGSGAIGLNHWNGALATTLALSPPQAAAAKVRLRTTAAAGASQYVIISVISLNFGLPIS